MAIQRFLALTEAEMGGISQIPEKIAWMGCHFSPDSPEITRPPNVLPPGSLLVLDDRVPLQHSEMDLVCRQLCDFASEYGSPALLLDFQRPKTALTEALVDLLASSLPVILPPEYAAGTDCAVFLPPVPPDVPIEHYIFPWNGRKIWLELALDGKNMTISSAGCTARSLLFAAPEPDCLRDQRLHCHYHVRLSEEQVQFNLWRSREDVEDLIREAEKLGVAGCVGLWQELGM